MAIIQGVTEKSFTNGKELYPLLSELIDCVSFPKPLERSQKTKSLIAEEGIAVTQGDLAAWVKCVFLKSRDVILARPNGRTKNEYRLRICLLNLSKAQRSFLANIMDVGDKDEGNRIFLGRVKALLQESL